MSDNIIHFGRKGGVVPALGNHSPFYDVIGMVWVVAEQDGGGN
jgi:hypothetical protein